MEYVKSFDILGIDTAQIPCIELQGVPNAATVGAVGLLGMDVTSEGREIYVCTAVNGAVYTWKPLPKGKDGTCVVKSEINDNGELILTLSDGKTLNAGVARGGKGKDGENGIDGVGVTKAELINGELVITLSDGSEKNVGKVTGATGKDGVSIVKVEANASCELIITLSNDTVINLGEIDKAKVPNTRTINGQPLSENIEITAEDVGVKIDTLYSGVFVGSNGEMMYPNTLEVPKINDYDVILFQVSLNGDKHTLTMLKGCDRAAGTFFASRNSDALGGAKLFDCIGIVNTSNVISISFCWEMDISPTVPTFTRKRHDPNYYLEKIVGIKLGGIK